MDKRILITGSSRGIGRAAALRLAREGYSLALHYNSSAAAAEEVLRDVKNLGASAVLLKFDISNREGAKAAIEDDMSQNGVYWGVVLNAGINADAPFPMMDENMWDSVLRTNLDGFYNVLSPIVMPMVGERKGGRIVALTSVSGLIGNRGQVNYGASKAGIIGAAKSLALELAKRSITVNCVAPGVIETGMTKDLPADEVKKMIPLRRFGKPEEVAAAISFLISEEAAYITRQVISVNGGLI
ncbi:MAG: 3-oxoacyl-ACP reductase FabG [Opitutales bacterium]|nr:3-oxoacyl-ACP reductase FabG [Opitutales bacterium]